MAFPRLKRLTERAIPLALVFLGAVALAFGQADRGTVEGIVTDASGASVGNAAVEIRRTETNDVISLRTNDLGRFYAPNLPLGTYEVTVEKEGFRTGRMANIVLQSQTSARADFQLSIGAVTETVEVTSQAPIIDASTATITQQLTTKQVQELPLIQVGRKRDITAYLQYLPGVDRASTWGARVNGSVPGNSEVFLDGAPASQGNVRGGIQENGPAIEQIGEFSVVTNSFNAEYGRTGSWFTNIVIRSGTNELHGSVYDYFANDALNARSFFQAERNIVRQHEGGFTVGGPVYIPKVYDGRNKTFFFFGQQLVFNRQAASGSLFTTPREDFRNGDFSEFVDGSGNLIPIYDPMTTRSDGTGGFVRDPFPGNRIPADRISPISNNILGLVPLPDIADAQQNNFRSRTGGGSYDNYVSTMKFDHSFNDHHKLSVTYSYQYNPRVISGRGWGVDSPLEGSQSPKFIRDHMGRINHDWIISSSLLNHFTFGVDRYNNSTQQVSQFEGWDDKLGIDGVIWDQGAFPVVNFGGGTASPQGLGGSDFSTNANGRYTFAENLSWIKGRHSLKFGGAYWSEYANAREGFQSSGAFSFSNLTTSLPNSPRYTALGSSFASFLLGDLSSGFIREPYSRGARYRSGALFAQDEWRATSHLTLSLGLRWEWNAAPFEPNGTASGFDPTLPNPGASDRLGALVFAGDGSGRNGNKALSNGWYNGFAPRLGIAYQATAKTVVRASAGIYYAPAFRTRMIAYGFNNSSSIDSSTGFTPVYNWTQSEFPQDFPRAPFIDPAFQNGQSVSSILPGTSRMPQVVSWTFSVQRELTSNLAVEASYIGSKSTHLVLSGSQSNMNVLDPSYLALGDLLFQDIESPAAQAAGISAPYPEFLDQRNRTVGQALRPYPQYLNVTEEWGPHGIARYHSLQLKVNKRYSSGLTLLGFYTWSKNMTNVEGGPIDFSPSDGAIQNPRNRNGEVSVSTDGSPHTFVASGSYELPFGPEKPYLNGGGVMGRLVGGWQFTGYVRVASGSPFAITATNGIGSFGYPSIRANYIGGDPLLTTNPRDFDPAEDRYVNPDAFAAPSTFELGNTARTLDWARGFTQRSEAISIAKRIAITERVRGVLRADVQNPFNFVRWNNPNTNITSAAFGTVTGAAAGRSIQLNATVEF